MAYDIIIRSGLLLDGNGSTPIIQDIAIEKGEIAAIGALDRAKASTEISAVGKYVAPGFIDITNHSDTHLTMFEYPGMESMIMQGVTTVIGGNCGTSLAPLVSRDAIKSVSKWADFSQIGIDWTSVEEFFTQMEKLRLGANFGMFVGFGTLRRGVTGDTTQLLSLEEKEKIRLLLGRALKQGVFGLSLGLSYGHERVSTTEELIEIAQPLGEQGGILKIHLRSEGAEILGAINEAIRIGREAGVSIIISHLKIIGRKSWHNAQKVLELIAYARSTGINITFDVSPYRTTGSPLYLLIPPWARRGGFTDLFKRIDTQIERKRIVEALAQSTLHYDKLVVIAAKHPTIVGKSIGKIAEHMGIAPEEALLEVVRGNEGRVSILGRTVSGRNTLMAIQDPNSFVVSDGYAVSQDAVKTGNLVHPRSFGAFPHFWHRLVQDFKLLKPEDAMVKITGGPAAALGIPRRGILAKDNFADIVVFDQALFRDRATYTNPYRYPAGLDWVIVNGQIVVSHGQYTGTRAGQILKKDHP